MEYILISDIVDSRKIAGKKLMAEFKALVDELNNRFKDSLKSPLTITLGDEYQGIANDFESTITILLAAEEAIIQHSFSFKLRHVVYLGEVDTSINRNSAHAMLGSGFIEARKAIESLKKNGLTRFFIHSGEPWRDASLNGLFQLLKSVIDSWKTSDSSIVSTFIEHLDYKKVAVVMDQDRSNVWRRAKTLRMSDYHLLKKLIHLSLSR